MSGCASDCSASTWARTAGPGELQAAAQAAEDAGLDSLWAGEHIVVPDPQVPPSPMAPQDSALDSLIALTWAAAHTTPSGWPRAS